MFVLTVDQRGSRRHGDKVPRLLSAVAGLVGAPGVAVPFDRTVGDEVQAVLDDPSLVVDVALRLVRLREWSIGIGIGPVDRPLPATAREGSGEAFVRARDAVERAKRRPGDVALAVTGARSGEPAERAHDAQALLRLLGGIVSRRSAAGWEVVDRLAPGGTTQREVAAALGISEQAVSQRVLASMWADESAVRPLAARLLREADTHDGTDMIEPA
jgi:hypothetical protein